MAGGEDPLTSWLLAGTNVSVSCEMFDEVVMPAANVL